MYGWLRDHSIYRYVKKSSLNTLFFQQDSSWGEISNIIWIVFFIDERFANELRQGQKQPWPLKNFKGWSICIDSI